MKSARNPIFPIDLLFGLNIPFARKRQLFCVDLDPGWTPDLGYWTPPKNAWRSIDLGAFSGLPKAEFLRRFGPPICIRGDY